jgi:HSP20 family protein
MDTQENAIKREDKENRQDSALSRLRHRALDFSPTGGELFWMNPFALMRRMTDEMNHVFGETGGGERGGWAPAIEVKEADGKYVVSAELPGLDPDDVKITVEENNLIIEGERTFEREENNKGIHRSERRYGKFYREIPLPSGASIDRAEAKFQNGVLEVAVPVADPASQRRQIPIQGTTTAAGDKTSKAA